LLADGTERAIEEIGVGQPVVTHTGKIRPVTKVYERSYAGKMYTVNVQGWQYPLTMTAEHPVAVIPNEHRRAKYGAFEAGELMWVKAEDLEPGDFVLIPYGHKDGKEQAYLDARQYISIASITIEEAEDIPVYNLEVADEHTYIANCIAVHNCTANAIGGALQFDELKQKEANPFVPSRLFIYYNERVIEHTVNSDSGARIRDGIKSVAKTGYCPETEWPYDISKFAVRPPAICYQDAKKYKALTYQRVLQNLIQMKGGLAAGTPFVAGFSVYESIRNSEVERTGDIPLPQQDEALIGGHAILIVGYDEAKRVFNLRNSWGEGWGDGGYGTLPYAYLTSRSLASDFWVINTVS
jgi:C1A family cysteine protease